MIRTTPHGTDAAGAATSLPAEEAWARTRRLIATVVGAVQDARRMRTEAARRYPLMDH